MWTETRPIGYRFRPGAKATRYRVNMAFNSSIWVAVTTSFVGGDVRLTELSVNLFTPKESKVKSTIFHFVKYWMKQIVLRKSAVKELSFEWSHHEILSTDWKVRTPRLHYSLWRVKALKQSWPAIQSNELKARINCGGQWHNSFFFFLPVLLFSFRSYVRSVFPRQPRTCLLKLSSLGISWLCVGFCLC